jgi:predicted DNA-binding antitoxin AbrB/MazE fold protein
MTTIIEATYDGAVFRPSQPVALEPNTTVKLIVEAATQPNSAGSATDDDPKLGEPYSFLKVLRSIRIEGPPDWSANVDKYLYGDLHSEEPGSEA